MPANMAHRVSSFGTSIFTSMSALATEHRAINLGQGFPDFAGPELIKDAAIAAIRADHNQYAPASGLPALREAAAKTYAETYGLHYDPQTEVTIMSGATEVLFATMMGLINPGDEVIVFEPAYDSYIPDILMAGGVPRSVLLRPPVDEQATAWRFDPEELRAAFNQRTRAIVVNTPHNPTGKVYDRGELQFIAELCQEHDVVAITDEVYDRLVFETSHVPLATLPGMRERTVTVNSTGKTFSVTGWKIGYALSTPALSDALRRAHQWITFATATPLQHAAAAALTDALTSDYYARLQRFYATNRNSLLRALQEGGWQTLPHQGSYFVIANLPPGWSDDLAFCRYLTSEVGVNAIPVSVFYSDPARAAHLVRFCFAKRPETIEAAAERLATMHGVSPGGG